MAVAFGYFRGMKNLSLSFCFLLTTCAFAQSYPTLNVEQTKDLQSKFTISEDGSAYYEEVFERDSADAEQLFTMANVWSIEQADDLSVRFGDLGMKIIVFTMEARLESLIAMAGPSSISYIVNIQARDGRYKVRITNFVDRYVANGTTTTVRLEDAVGDKYLFKNNGSVKTYHAKVVLQYYRHITDMLESLQKHMEGPLMVPDTDDDW